MFEGAELRQAQAAAGGELYLGHGVEHSGGGLRDGPQQAVPHPEGEALHAALPRALHRLHQHPAHAVEEPRRQRLAAVQEVLLDARRAVPVPRRAPALRQKLLVQRQRRRRLRPKQRAQAWRGRVATLESFRARRDLGSCPKKFAQSPGK